MTTKRSVDMRAIATVAAGYAAGLMAYPSLPGAFLQQEKSARVLVAFTLPTTALVIYALFRSLWLHDRVRSGNGVFESTYYAIVLRVLLFVVAMHALVMFELTQATGVGLPVPGGRIVIVMLGVVIMAIGNLLPRTRPNIAVGLRTARTLANAHLWQQVHRTGGYITVALGAIVVATGFALSHNVAGAVVSGAGLVAAMSVYLTYRRYSVAPPGPDTR